MGQLNYVTGFRFCFKLFFRPVPMLIVHTHIPLSLFLVMPKSKRPVREQLTLRMGKHGRGSPDARRRRSRTPLFRRSLERPVRRPQPLTAFPSMRPGAPERKALARGHFKPLLPWERRAAMNSALALSGTIALGLAGQIVFSLFADAKGLFEMAQRMPGWRDFAGLALITAGALILIFYGSAS